VSHAHRLQWDGVERERGVVAQAAVEQLEFLNCRDREAAPADFPSWHTAAIDQQHPSAARGESQGGGSAGGASADH
jgi:hypothetical protein